MNSRGQFIKNTIGIVTVLAVAFLSQQHYFKNKVYNFAFPFLKKGESYFSNLPLAKKGDQLKDNLYSQVSGGVKNGEGVITNAKDVVDQSIDQQKKNVENIQKNSWDNFKKYVAEKTLDALGVDVEDLSQCKK